MLAVFYFSFVTSRGIYSGIFSGARFVNKWKIPIYI